MRFNDSFQLFAEKLFEPVIILDPEADKIIFANSAAKTFFDAGNALIGCTIHDIVADSKVRLSDISKTVARLGNWSGEDIALVTKEKHKLSCNLNAAAMEQDSKALLSLMVQNRSKSELAVIGQDVRKIAHDIRGALTSAQLMCERLSTHEDFQVRRSSELLTRSLNRVFQMCLEILNVGRAKKLEPHPVQFYLSDLISDLNASIPGKDGRDFISLSASEEILIEADYDQIFRVLLNLSRNARNAGASEVLISGLTREQETEITLSDNGPGIPEDTIPSLFKQKTRYSGRGTGLGLIITHEIVTNHNGRIELVKNDDEGAVFSIYLPREIRETALRVSA